MMDRFKGSGFLKRISIDNRVAQATNLDRTGTRLELTEANNPPVHFQAVRGALPKPCG